MTKEQIEARKLEIREEVEKTEDIEKVFNDLMYKIKNGDNNNETYYLGVRD